MTRLSLPLLSILLLMACSAEQTTELKGSRILQLETELQEILTINTPIEILAEGFNWSEGPVWVEKGGFLLFSDVPENKIYKWQQGIGLSVFLEPSGYTGSAKREGENGSNGLILDQNGKLLLCQHGDRRVARLATNLSEPEPTYETIVNTFEEKRFNSPNDLVLDSGGRLYFTDPPYGLPKNSDGQEKKELDYQGVFRIDPDNGVVLLHDELSRPNGIGLSPDEKTLYVANSDPDNPILMKFDLDDNNNVSGSEILFDASELEGPGLPDGLAVNSRGIIFATGPGGVLILKPSGEHIGTIYTGVPTANVTLDTEEKNLFITADSYLLRVKLN